MVINQSTEKFGTRVILAVSLAGLAVMGYLHFQDAKKHKDDEQTAEQLKKELQDTKKRLEKIRDGKQKETDKKV